MTDCHVSNTSSTSSVVLNLPMPQFTHQEKNEKIVVLNLE